MTQEPTQEEIEDVMQCYCCKRCHFEQTKGCPQCGAGPCFQCSPDFPYKKSAAEQAIQQKCMDYFNYAVKRASPDSIAEMRYTLDKTR